MKGTKAVFTTFGDQGVAALYRDGQLDDLLIDAPGGALRPGAVYRAKAGKLLKGLGGAMMDTPDGRVFLRNAKGMGPGQTRLVQVVSFVEAGKAPPVTTKLVFKSRYCLATPGAPGLNLSRDIRDEERRVALRALLDDAKDEAIGLVVRSASADADDDVVFEDVKAMLDLARSVVSEDGNSAPELLLDGPDAADLAWREWPIPDTTVTDPDPDELADLKDDIARLRTPHVTLSGGASLFVEPTRALVSVDVNTGADASPAGGLKANLAAAAALPRALRLRGLGGQVVVDFAPMPKKERRQIEGALRLAFKQDPVETSLVGWTTLGLFELQRKRERLPLAETGIEVDP